MTEPAASAAPRRVILRLDDIDRHGSGCPCGQCDTNGKAYGCAVFDVPPSLEIEDDEALADLVQTSGPLDRLYAASEPAALDQTRALCAAQRWSVVDR
jgi:hypothetical protein